VEERHDAHDSRGGCVSAGMMMEGGRRGTREVALTDTSDEVTLQYGSPSEHMYTVDCRSTNPSPVFGWNHVEYSNTTSCHV
jgi:hypothetical protein